MLKGRFLSVVAFAALAVAEAFAQTKTQVNALTLTATKSQMADAAKRTPTQAEDAAQKTQDTINKTSSAPVPVPGAGTIADARKIGGMIGGGLRGLRNRGGDQERGAEILVTEKVKEHLANGPVAVFYGSAAQASDVRSKIESTSGLPGRMTLVTVDPASSKDMGVYGKVLEDEAKTYGMPQVHFYTTTADKPSSILNGFQVTPETLAKALTVAPAAAPAPAAPKP